MRNGFFEHLKVWNWEVSNLDGSIDRVRVTLEMTGHEIVEMNGSVLEKQFSPFGGRYSIGLSDGRKAELKISPDWRFLGMIPKCTFSVDCVPLPPSDRDDETKKPLPKWALGFQGALILLPIATLGGAIPVFLAIVGIALCRKIARREDWEAPIKILICSAIVLAAWSVSFWLATVLRSQMYA